MAKHKLWEELPAPAPHSERDAAVASAKDMVKRGEKLIRDAEAVADKYGFNLKALSDKTYIPQYVEESTWMPSTDEVEGSGYLEFTWTASNEGTWKSEAELDW